MGFITGSAVKVLELFGGFSQNTLGLEPAFAAPIMSILVAALITGYFTDYENLRSSLSLDWSDAVLVVVVLGSLTSIYYTTGDPVRVFVDNWTVAILIPIAALVVRNWTGVNTKR